MISVVIPVYNEEKNIRILHAQLIDVFKKLSDRYEIIFVDDGSTDNTFAEIQSIAPVIGVRLRKRSGQTQAVFSGIGQATGEIIITIDGDLQNDPADIPGMLRTLNEGYDVVSGWRKDRWSGQRLRRKIPSVIANAIISKVTGVSLNDHGCGLKVYRRQLLNEVVYIGEAHRMLAAYIGMLGGRVAEVPVSYNRRLHGASKYNMSRTFRVILDVFAMYFFRLYVSRPMHFFGYIGFWSIGIAALASLASIILRLGYGVHFIRTPLPTLVAIFSVIGVQFIVMGLLAELITQNDGKPKRALGSIAEVISK